MPRGAKPGERRGGRGKGTPNKKTIGEEAFKRRIDPRQEDFDAFDQMGRIARYFLGEAAREQQKGEAADKKLIRDYLREAWRIAKEMAPYQLPRLASVELKTKDLDLSKLTDADLTTFLGFLTAATAGPTAESTGGDRAAPNKPGRLN